MSAPIGNRYWETRTSHGRKSAIETAEGLWAAVIAYFQWVEESPLKGEKLLAHQGVIIRGEYSKMRAPTIEGLCNFLGITSRTWRNYRVREDFVPIVERAEQIMYAHKFEGAAADLLNANIIARDLGLSEKNEVTGKDGGPIETTTDTRDLARAVLDILREARVEKDEGSEDAP